MKILKGIGVGKGTVEGIARVITDYKDGHTMEDGEILVSDETNQWFVVFMNSAKAVVTQTGSAESHAAIIANKLGIPAVIGVEGILGEVKTGFKIRVDGSRGEVTVMSRRFHDVIHQS